MKPTADQIIEARGKCSKCNGSGYVGIDDGITNPKDCNDCNGTGNATFETSKVIDEGRVQPTYPIGHVETWPCEECDGNGKYRREYIYNTSCDWIVTCSTCHGKGTLSAEVVEVSVETKTRPVTSVVFGKTTKIIYTWREVA